MINEQLIAPRSIVVVGGSNDISKPGGKVLKNILDSNFKGALYVTHPKEVEVQGIKCFKSPADLPEVDLAIVVIAAKFVPETVEILARQKSTKAFIIPSAGFSEESEEGKKMERRIVEVIDETGGCLIGPNCIGAITPNYPGVFTTPIPQLDPQGCDFVSGSGATAVFIMESGIPKGLTFSSIYSVGNSAQLGVEEVVEYWDTHFDPEKSPRVKLLYLETIHKPAKLLKHARSLIQKGCKIAAIKAGSSEAGSRAASSHTGALATSDVAVDALFRKAGIVRCYGREDLATVASIFMHKEMKGKRIAIITHAGGPAVMLTDVLSGGGFEIPHLEGPETKELLSKLHPGSSVANPIDFLATGNAAQLDTILDYCEHKFHDIDAMVVIFGSPGLFDVTEVYKVIDERMKKCQKPIYPVIPSIINAAQEIQYFLSQKRMFFPDEVLFGQALNKIVATPPPSPSEIDSPAVDMGKVEEVVQRVKNGYLSPVDVQTLLDACGLERAQEKVVKSVQEAMEAARELGYPLVMKVVGPLHKSDVGGVALGLKEDKAVEETFGRMMGIEGANAVLMQPMLSGTELFVGAKKEDKFGHIVLCGTGGILIEVLKDVVPAICPIGKEEALGMIRRLKGYKIIQGVRGQEGVNEDRLAEVILRVSALLKAVPEISEMDLNPLLGSKQRVIAVDARIKIEKP